MVGCKYIFSILRAQVTTSKMLVVSPSSVYSFLPATVSLYSFLWKSGICAELRSLDTAVDFNCGPVQPLHPKCFVISLYMTKKFIESLCLQERSVLYNYYTALSDGHPMHSGALPAFLALISAFLEIDLGCFMLTHWPLLLHMAHWQQKAVDSSTSRLSCRVSRRKKESGKS